MSNVKCRKGIGIGDVVPIALAILFIGIILGIGSYINYGVGTTSTPTTSVKCEAITFPATTGGDAATIYPYLTSVSYMYNASNCSSEQLLTSGNYTVGSQMITGAFSTTFRGVSKWVNYTVVLKKVLL